MSTRAIEHSVAPGRKRRSGAPVRKRKNDLATAMLFILPAAVGFVVFYLVPAIRGVYFSFTQYNILGTPTWIGTENFEKIAVDPLFWNAMWVTLGYVILNIGFQTVIAILLAVMMQRLTKSIVLRGALLMPWLISNVIAAMLWFWLLDYQIGLFNQAIEWLGMTKIAFFADEMWAIPTIAFVNVWRHMGYTALLVFAGMQTIPKYIYEAASIDGASEWTSFWKMTLPLLRPVLAMILVITVTGSFQVFDTVAVTTRGGPVNVTRVMQYYIYQKAFGEGQFGYGSALAVILFIILAVLAAIQLRMLRAGESDLA
ncbi:MAG TPA: sugar ABC transporter permease [Arachnia sp.]|nr:sugar ABC transporter permease [Arachnia sp.]